MKHQSDKTENEHVANKKRKKTTQQLHDRPMVDDSYARNDRLKQTTKNNKQKNSTQNLLFQMLS